MTQQASLNKFTIPPLRNAVWGLISLGIASLLVLLCLLPANRPAEAGENVWSWGGVSGNVETMLSNPLHPEVVYALTDQGQLYKTSNGGVSWSTMPALPHAGVLLTLGLAPDDDDVLFLWGYDSGQFLYRSTDGGSSWQALSKAGAVAISPASWREVYLASENSLFKSIDGGETWTEIGDFTASCPRPEKFYIAPSAPHVMMGIVSPAGSMDFKLCKTMDGGVTWSLLSLSSPMIHSLVFDPKNSNTIYLATIGGGWKSTSGGSSWQPISNGLNNPAQFVIDPDNTQVIHAADLNQSGGVFESLDGGASWTILNTGIEGLSVRTMAIGWRSPLKIYAGVMFSGVWEITRTTLNDYSITVNDGALFTNQSAVTLTLTAPPGTTQMLLSNDGGFGGATWEAFADTKPWAITSYGEYVIPRTVYAKFMSSGGQISGQYQDDIILDQTAPTGGIEILAGGSATAPGAYAARSGGAGPHVSLGAGRLASMIYLPLVSKNLRPGVRSVVLDLSAHDDLSGVDKMLVSNDANFAGAEWQDYAVRLDWLVSDRGTTTVYVQYGDRAGNLSEVYSAPTPTH
ncbi:MAG: hypothetical protein JW726_10250 [Anaerolineales bacterium]|nr:hypothetical protein [Anaerolineales bacterium]